MRIRPTYNYRHRTLNHNACCIYMHDFTMGELGTGQNMQVLEMRATAGTPYFVSTRALYSSKRLV